MNEKWTDNRPSITHERHKPNGVLSRIFGGSPPVVVGKLVLLSIVVGFIITQTGLDPWDLVRDVLHSFGKAVKYIWDHGFELFEPLLKYFFLGAAVVVPIWLVVRLMKGLSGKP
jgi:hypothetical protein